MVENTRNTAAFKTPVNPHHIPSELNDLVPVSVMSNDAAISEGFQFSFNNASKEEDKKSADPSPSPIQENHTKHFPIVEELSSLQNQIREINSKISQNLAILREKQEKNKELKVLLQKHEVKSTVPTDSSFIDSKCSCNKDCIIL